MKQIKNGNKYYRSLFVEHLYQIIEVLGVTFIVKPLLEIALKSAVEVALHLVTET